ncbi:MAG: glycosyl hydrolase [Chloroflexaceae bacterium]|nr:glycosyl hydrolase [Chloroflexaceae bacterium]
MSRRILSLVLLPMALLLASSSALSSTVIAAPEAMREPVGPPSFGINSHLATRYPDPTAMDVPAQTLADLNITWVREDFHWHRIQYDRDVWDWTFTDAAMRALLKEDIQVLGVLGPSVGWATPYTGDNPHDVSFYAPDPELFLDYVRAVVARYRRYVKHWEIWNEPDHPYFWQPEPDPVAYADLLKRTSAVIKEIDPDAQVVIGGFNPFNTTFVRTVAEEGAWDSFDILALHPYVDPYTPEEGNLAAALDIAHALNYQYGERPIWVTEIGWASGPGDRDAIGFTDETEQASFLVRSLLLLWANGAERIFWYMLKDDAHNPYGLYRYGAGRTDFSTSLRKPAYNAMRTLNRELEGATFVERRDLFDSIPVESFTASVPWKRAQQPNGQLALSESGVGSIAYNFSTRGNDYLVFEREQPVRIPGKPYALGVWVYGDGSTHTLRAWCVMPKANCCNSSWAWRANQVGASSQHRSIVLWNRATGSRAMVTCV